MNTNSPNSSFGVTAADLRAYDWQTELAATTRQEFYAFSDVLVAKAKSVSEAGDAKGACVFRLLAAVASFWPNFGDAARPFRPARVDYQTGKRSLAPEDLAHSDLEALAGILDEIKDP